MKINIDPYNPNWAYLFIELKNEILESLHFLNPTIEHIGSTSIIDLSSKPIIDILVGIPSLEQLNETIQPLIDLKYIYFEKFNSSMPNRRFYVKLKNKTNFYNAPEVFTKNDIIPNELNEHKLAHVHIFENNSLDYKRHIAFRDYLKKHSVEKEKYQQLKLDLSSKFWKDGSEYNSAKNDFIKNLEQKAIQWYDGK
jgi:GrpB-like predicted nucleotidyltransferase (UPF0157 family)